MPDRHTEADIDTADDVDFDVDFVVGVGAKGHLPGPPHRGPFTQSARRRNLRLRLTLAGAAAILALGTIIARASAGHHALEKASHTPSPQTSTSAVATSPKAIAAVHAAFKDSEVTSTKTVLLFRTGHAGSTLLSRTITARIPIGTIQITVNRAATGADPNRVSRRSDQEMTTFVATSASDGYAVTATLAQKAARSDPSSLLEDLANDQRLLAIR